MTLKKALLWAAFWVILSLIFCMGVWVYLGPAAALTWLSAYIVEKLLSFDNLFMFFVIFRFFGTQADQQRRALNWGMIGSIIMRGLVLFTGVTAIAAAPWLLYLCGAFLLFSGLKMLWNSGGDDEEEQAPEGMINRLRRCLPAASVFLLTILTIELTDILFALDSIPAALGLTSNFFLLATSNLFAVLGLRSLYFVMLEAIKKFHFLERGVATILSGIGLKMLLVPLITIPTPITFGFVLGVLSVAIVLSMMKEYANKPEKKGTLKCFCTFFFKPTVKPVEEIEMMPLNHREENPCP